MCFAGRAAALGAIAAHFQARDQNVETAIALNLAFEPIKQGTLKLRDPAATKARHVNVVTLGTALVKVLLAFEVHEIQFVYQTMALQQVERPVNRYPVDVGVDFASPPQYLRGIQMLLCNFDDSQDCPPLASHAQAAGREFSLQATGSFGFG